MKLLKVKSRIRRISVKEMITEKEKVINFELLGTFSYASPYRETPKDVHTTSKKIGRKTLSFLQYLIVNHGRNISAEELTDTFWTEEESSDPANALRNMLHKIRNLLKDMFPQIEKELLMTLCGCYAWNPEIEIELDTDQFEKTCLEARKYSGRQGTELLRKAVSFYKGDFLAGNDSEWARGPRQYYRTLYLDACKTLLPLLEEKEEWTEIVSVCSQAYQTDSCMEEFTAYPMRAFIAMGQPKQALERYEALKAQMLKELGLPPTEHIEQIRTLALQFGKEDKKGDQEIFRLVCEEEEAGQAFLCSFGVFQSIVALERRHLARSGQISTLVIVSLGNHAVRSADVKRLERILIEGLRTGDPIARLTAGSYILMLAGADAENAQIVTNRIDCSFHRTYRHSSAQLYFRISVLCPGEKIKL